MSQSFIDDSETVSRSGSSSKKPVKLLLYQLVFPRFCLTHNALRSDNPCLSPSRRINCFMVDCVVSSWRDFVTERLLDIIRDKWYHSAPFDWCLKVNWSVMSSTETSRHERPRKWKISGFFFKVMSSYQNVFHYFDEKTIPLINW